MMKLKKQKFEYLPYRVELDLRSAPDEWTLENKIVSLAGRNRGQPAMDDGNFNMGPDLVLDFADEKGLNTFVRKVNDRYPDVQLEASQAEAQINWEYCNTPVKKPKRK